MKYLLEAIVTFTLFLVVLLAASGCDFDKREFIGTAQTTFEKIMKGDPSAAHSIAWTELRIDGEEIGRSFMALSTDYEKSSFQTGTIARLAREYSAKNWTAQRVQNWRIQSKGLESATVVADAPGGMIVYNLQKRGGEKKIVSMEIK